MCTEIGLKLYRERLEFKELKESEMMIDAKNLCQELSCEDVFGEACPKCSTLLMDAPGIGPYCPNKDCDVIDNILGWDNPQASI